MVIGFISSIASLVLIIVCVCAKSQRMNFKLLLATIAAAFITSARSRSICLARPAIFFFVLQPSSTSSASSCLGAAFTLALPSTSRTKNRTRRTTWAGRTSCVRWRRVRAPSPASFSPSNSSKTEQCSSQRELCTRRSRTALTDSTQRWPQCRASHSSPSTLQT